MSHLAAGPSLLKENLRNRRGRGQGERDKERDEQKSGFFLFPSIGMSARRRSESGRGTEEGREEGAVFGQRARPRSPGVWRPNESIGDGAGPAALNPPQQNVGPIALIYPTA